jgi:hypothetical protein
MTTTKKGYRAKHAAGSAVDPEIEAAIRQTVTNNKLPCETATAIAARLSKSMPEVGATLDLLEIAISQCQLGLFGYYPEKKVVTAATQVYPLLEKAINEKLIDGRLSCSAAWELAQAHALTKMAVASACEAISVKIKPCQLGAF